MPRNVRNFWLTLEVDGKKSTVATGPVGENGGFNLLVRMRDKGSISDKMFRVVGKASRDGKLIFEVDLVEKGAIELVYVNSTER